MTNWELLPPKEPQRTGLTKKDVFRILYLLGTLGVVIAGYLVAIKALH